jgi:hypothetical protein
MSNFGSPTDTLPTALGFALGFGLVIVILAITKAWYTRRRRIQLIHAPLATCSLPLYNDLSLCSSRSTLATQPSRTSLGEFKAMSSPFFVSYMGAPSSVAASPPTTRSGADNGILVGLFGSPDWEIRLTGQIDKTTRTDAIEKAKDDVMLAVHAMPARSLSRMSSRATLSKKGSIVSMHSVLSPLLGRK